MFISIYYNDHSGNVHGPEAIQHPFIWSQESLRSIVQMNYLAFSSILWSSISILLRLSIISP